METWLSYRPSDFLLFAPQTYYRLFELYNAAVWPAQFGALALGLVLLALLRRPGPGRSRALAALLAACWLGVALAFHARRYATINWAAVYFAWAFGAQAALLLWTGALRGRLGFRVRDTAGRIGLGLFLFALFLQPLAGPLFGRSWRQVELFGLAPDPTAVATLGLLLATERRRPALFAIPLLWCALTGATLWTMGAPDAWMAPAAALLAVGAAIAFREGTSPRRSRRSAAP